MFRILQGDVGSGKTIVSFLAAANVISSKYQTAMMAPTEILSAQHYNNFKDICKLLNISIQILTGSTKPLEKRRLRLLRCWLRWKHA